MKVLVVGSGAREHALCWKFSRSNRISGLFAAPGNAGIDDIATSVPGLAEDDSHGITRFARDQNIDLVFVASRQPIRAGLIDALEEGRVPVIGPDTHAARLEFDPPFTQSFTAAHAIPVVSTEDSGSDATPVDVSLFALTDGKTYAVMPTCVDYRKAGVGGKGPTTDGMGAICPVPWLSPADHTRIIADIVAPTFRGFGEARIHFRGVLHFSLRMSADGPRLVAYGVRLGDPEAQVLLPLLRSDFANWCEAVSSGNLASFPVAYHAGSAVGIVIAAAGYPGEAGGRHVVSRLPVHPEGEALVFHAGTTRHKKTLYTGSGRCFTTVGIGPELLTARSRAYSAARGITFPGSWYRPDVGSRIFGD